VTRLHILLILLAVLLITAYAGWLNSVIQPRMAPEPEAARHRPDYFLDRTQATLMDPDGRVQYRLRADRVEHYRDDNSLQLVHPELRYFPPDGTTWKVVADAGRIHDDGGRVFLDGSIDMQRLATRDSPPLRLVTRDLLIRPREGYAETAARAIITSPGSRLAGTGMRIDMEERRLELLADGEGRYVLAN